MKTLTLSLLALALSHISMAQKPETVLSSPEKWPSEIIEFPMGFAREIDLKGFEDLRFMPGWRDTTSSQFFSYMFVWYVDQDSAFTESRMTNYFNIYYDGLMNINGHNERDSSKLNQLDKTLCLFVKTDEGFTGKMRVYENFVLKNYLTLNVKVEISECEKTSKQIVRCEISPQGFKDHVWKDFKLVEVIKKCD
ncbi:MAG: hypothetical protein ACI857_002530 [Arenicella sp.]|jgi:hypothetical protein